MKNIIREKISKLPGKMILTYASTSLVCQAIRFLILLVSTRFFLPEIFGLFAKATLFLSISGILTNIGQNEAFVAFKGEDRRYTRFYFQLSLFLSLLSVFFLFLLVNVFFEYSAEFKRLGLCMALILIFESLLNVPQFYLQKKFQFKWTGACDVIGVGSYLVMLVSFSTHGDGVGLLLGCRLVESSIRCVLLYARSSREIVGFCWDKDVILYYWNPFVRNSLVRTWVDCLMQKIDIIILSNFISVHQLGIYERLQYFLQIPLSLGANLIDRVSLVNYSSKQDNKNEVLELLKSYLTISSGVSVFIVLMISLLFPLIMPFIWAQEIVEELYRLWRWAVVLAFLKPVVLTFSIFFHGTGLNRQIFYQHTFLLVVSLLTGLILTALIGLQGMILALTISYSAVLLFQFFILKRSRYFLK